MLLALVPLLASWCWEPFIPDHAARQFYVFWFACSTGPDRVGDCIACDHCFDMDEDGDVDLFDAAQFLNSLHE